MKPPSIAQRWSLVLILAAVGVVILLAGCGVTASVTPKPVQASTIAFDGNTQNAGIIALTPDGGAIISPNHRDYYNALIAIYGSAKWQDRQPIFVPALHADDGVTRCGANYCMTGQAVEHLTLMHQWFKMGRLP